MSKTHSWFGHRLERLGTDRDTPQTPVLFPDWLPAVCSLVFAHQIRYDLAYQWRSFLIVEGIAVFLAVLQRKTMNCARVMARRGILCAAWIGLESVDAPF